MNNAKPTKANTVATLGLTSAVSVLFALAFLGHKYKDDCLASGYNTSSATREMMLSIAYFWITAPDLRHLTLLVALGFPATWLAWTSVPALRRWRQAQQWKRRWGWCWRLRHCHRSLSDLANHAPPPRPLHQPVTPLPPPDRIRSKFIEVKKNSIKQCLI